MHKLDLVNLLNEKLDKLREEYHADAIKIHRSSFVSHCHKRMTYVELVGEKQLESCTCCKVKKTIKYLAVCKNPECECKEEGFEYVGPFFLSIVGAVLSIVFGAIQQNPIFILPFVLSMLILTITIKMVT